ncbi:M64 family metallopeptidase [Streptomyces sp. I05A-00742]|uniref:M64 family metallopeptidase n=1 Tax=Streptomyces sp. I05A-00742 TaxID=2732853 RepID=UPI001BB29D47|nr:M64 family metallopeptidase [Streptomyces sp. I05A-00742]
MGTGDGAVVGTTKIVDNGPAAARWNLVIMGDGYQSGQLGQFANDAQNFVNVLFATAPFTALRPAINVYRVDVRSTDSGADDPTACGGTGAAPRTYFDAAFCNNGTRRLLTVNSNTALTVAGQQVPQWSMVMVIVNSTVYGGSGGPSVAVFSLAPNANEIGLHEMGHSAFGLADEYEYYLGCGVDTNRNTHPAVEPAEPNVTINANKATNKWRDLVAPATAMPTTKNANCAVCDPQPNPVGAATVGAFEGAHYYHCAAFRPQYNCRMRVLGQPFCAVCQRRIRETLAPRLPLGQVSVVARSSGHMDVFWVNRDGKVWSNWWDQTTGMGWHDHNAFPIATTFPSPAAHDTGIASIARSSGHMDVFWAGADGKIWSNWWDQTTGMGWFNHNPFPIGRDFPVAAAAGTGIAVVARNPNHMDVFWAGTDGKIWSNWWDLNTGMGWYDHDTFPIGATFPVPAGPGTGIAVVARNPNHMDVFWAGTDGKIWSNWWDLNTGMGWYNHNPFPIATSFPVPAAPGTGIAVVARNPNHMDVFWAGTDGKIWSNWWDQTTGMGWYDHGAFSI